MKSCKFISILLILLCSAGMATAQQIHNDTLVGVLKNADQKVVKSYPVSLGKRTVKTNRHGIFTFPRADLNDTLFVWSSKKKDKTRFVIPVNGFNFLNVTLKKGAFDINRSATPDKELQDILDYESKKMISTDRMTRAQIESLHCQTLYEVLQHISGVHVNGTNVNIRNSMSFNSGTDPLIVVDGIPMQDLSMLGNLPIQTVEEVEVQKDGAEYGARGANGVIKIRTSK